MRVRHGTEADVPALIEMGRRFIASSGVYAEQLAVVPSRQQTLATVLLEQGGLWVLEAADMSVVGMLGLVLAPLPLTGELAALECMWWVEPEHRHGRGALQMWLLAEDWAREQGATCIHMLQPWQAERLATVYRRRGYVPVETTWAKRFDGGAHGLDG